MCWSGEASTVVAAIGLSSTAYAVYKREPAVLTMALGYFSLMELLQAVSIVFIAAGFGSLGADAFQAIFDFVNDVMQAQQVLIDTFQAAEGFDFLGFESADAGRFFEDCAAVFSRRL